MRHACTVLLLLMAACDPSASSTTPGSSGVPGRAAASGESCASTADCGAELRCVQLSCGPTRGSRAGEYHAAAGRLASKEGRQEAAISAYAEAVKAFEADKAKPPAWLYCEQGAALLAAGGDPQRYELAARVFHRCLLDSLPGSIAHRRAADGLARLGKEGLDPQLVARDKLADRYLVKKPSMPASDKLVLTVSSPKPYKHRTFDKFVARLGKPDLVEVLRPCWKAHWEAARKPEMKISLTFKHGYKLDAYDDFLRTTLVIKELSPTGNPAVDGARDCAREVLTPIADQHTKGRYDERRWTADSVFAVKPGK